MKETLIIDDGSGLCKAGLGNGDAPQFMFPPYVGFPKQNSSLGEIGEEAISNRNQLILRTPIERGIITNWDLMEKIWHYTFNSMKLYPIDYFTLLCQSPSNPKSNREKAIVIMFESFNVAGFDSNNSSTRSKAFCLDWWSNFFKFFHIQDKLHSTP